MAVMELTRNSKVIFKLGDILWLQFWGKHVLQNTFCCSSGKYRLLQMQINETMQLKNDFFFKMKHIGTCATSSTEILEIVNFVTMK